TGHGFVTVVPILGPIQFLGKSRAVSLSGTRVQIVRGVAEQMIVSSIVVDALYLSEHTVVVEGEVCAVVQTHSCEHGGVVIVWTINLQATAKTRRHKHLPVTECGPIM